MDKINIVAPIGYTGYGVVGRNLVHSLDKAGINISLFPIGESIECPPKQKEVFAKCLNNREQFDSRSPSLKIWHQNDLAMFPGSPRIAYTFFELDRLKNNEIHHLSQCDKVLVACEWAKQICQKHNITADVLPCGVSDVFRPSSRKPNQKCVFLNVGKWEVRKGHLELAKAFRSLLKRVSNVELWMMSENRFYRNGENEWWKNYYRNCCGNNVKFVNWVPTDTDVAHIMQRADIGVFPSKAEAWNLELLEMMACGKQVICTDYSGHTEFATSKNSILLQNDGMEDAIDSCEAHPDGFWFKGFGQWARIDYLSLADSMYNAFLNWGIDKTDVNIEGLNTADIFSWDNSAKRLMEIVWKKN